jgi:hypothetical protein
MYTYKYFGKGVLDKLRETHDMHIQYTPTPDYMTSFPVEGITMLKQVQELLKEIRDSFARSMTRIRFMALSPNICTSVAIYREGDTFALGFIGYSDGKYYVSHPSIKNEKYGSHKSEYHTITSSGRGHVIKAVRRYCTPATPADICEALETTVHSKFNASYMQSTKELQEAENKLSYSGMALEALAHMLKGEAPRPDVVEAVRQYETLKVEAMADIGVSPRLVCFMFNQLKSGVTVTQFRTLYAMSYSRSINMFIRKTGDAVEDRRIYTTTNELPADVMGKLSVLSMVENEQYVKGVGYRHLPSVYFLEMSPEMERAARVACDA